MNKIIETSLFFFLSLFQGITLVVGSTNSNFNHNYWFNRQISLDPNSFQVKGETESINFYHNTEAACEDANVNNHDIKDGNANNNNNNLSNHFDNVAMFFHGPNHNHHNGYQTQANTKYLPSFIATGECAFVSYIHDRNNNWDEDDYFDDDEDDDDDDDDNDGHSSMLSNASIRQRVSATRVSYSQGYDGNSNGNG